MNKFDTQIHCDDFSNEPTQEQIIELMREAAEIQDAQATSWEGIFEDGHTDEAYDAWLESQIHDGIWN
jgi:serine/threonine protein phosphatase PrpC